MKEREQEKRENNSKKTNENRKIITDISRKSIYF